MENWVSVVGYDGFYEVSDQGSVRSLDRMVNGRYGTKRIQRGKVLRPAPTECGYLFVTLQADKRTKYTGVHRIVCAAFNGPSDKPTVNHKDGNKHNNVPGNLEWATYLENQTHADSTGLRQIKGERNGRAKLTEVDVASIRSAGALKYGDVARIARQYGVSGTMIRNVLAGRNWSPC